VTPAEAVEPEPSKAQAGGGNAKEKAEVERIPKSRRDCVVVWVYPMTIVGNNARKNGAILIDGFIVWQDVQ